MACINVIYSTSTIDITTVSWNLVFQNTTLLATKKMFSLVNLLVSLFLVKSEFI